MGKRKLDKVAAECLWNQIIEYTMARLEAEAVDNIGSEADYAMEQELILQDIFTEITGWRTVYVTKQEGMGEIEDFWELK